MVLTAALTSVRYRRHLKDETRAAQAQWTLDAGVRFAANKIRNDETYVGEKIYLDSGLPKFDLASVTIETDRNKVEGHVQVNVITKLTRSKNQKSLLNKRYQRSSTFVYRLNSSRSDKPAKERNLDSSH